MISKDLTFLKKANNYLKDLNNVFTNEILLKIELLAKDLLIAWEQDRNVYICGNGGSAANAIHIANDFHYGIGACGSDKIIPGIKVEALSANQGVLTCLANDTGYENIFSQQLIVKSKPKDLVILLSGSGNSPNIIKALETARSKKLKSFAISAFNGGKCKSLADVSIHFPINDMQIAEDTQLIVSHICMQWLSINKPHSLILNHE